MTKTYTYQTSGTCSRQIDFTLEEGIIRSVRFTGGCQGNTSGVAALLCGMRAGQAIDRLAGIDCKGRGTSCPDQFARALREALAE